MGRCSAAVLAGLAVLAAMLLFYDARLALFPHLEGWWSRLSTALFVGSAGSAVAWVVSGVVAQAREQARTLQRAIEQSPVSVIITDRSGAIEYVNPAFSLSSGWSPREALGRNPRFLQSGETSPEEYRNLWQTITAGREWRGELHNRRKDGEPYWESASISPVFDRDGDITHFLAVKADITEHVRMRRQLAEALDFERQVISVASQGILAYESSGRCVMANEAAARMVGASVPDLLKQNFRELESWRKLGLTQMAEKALEKGEPQEGEIQGTTSFGKEVWIRVHCSPFARNGEPHLLVTHEDVLERRRAQARIREQADLLDQTSDAIILLGAGAIGESRIRYWNKGAERIYGWSAAEAVGKGALEVLARGTISPALQNCARSLDERGRWSGELEEFTREGRKITVSGRANLIRDQEGRPKHILIINSDVTEKKSLERVLLRAQRLEGLGTLAAGIAHDLNNILAPILMSVQVLKEQVPDEQGRRLIDILEANVVRGAKLVKQVMIFGRGIEGERIPIQIERAVLPEIEQIIRETFPKSIAFASEAAADLGSVVGDQTQIQQVLLNLCVNARDAMPSGGSLAVRLSNAELNEEEARSSPGAHPGRYVLIEVSDTGSGIPPEVLDRMFDPFFTTKAPGKGTGLGLSTVRGIVKSHGGFILCATDIGKGTTFRVYLPAGQSHAPAAPAAPGRFLRGRGELILLVDDEEPVRESVRQTLEHFGYRVLMACNGAEGAALFSSRHGDIALVLTDMAMPVMDGPTMIAALQCLDPKVKIVGSSGVRSYAYGTTASAVPAGIRNFVPKPYAAEVLLATIRRVLDGTG